MIFGGFGITEDLFNWIRASLPDGKHILELGSGDVSTQYLPQFYRLTSVEDNPYFIGRHPSNFIHVPLDPATGWYDLSALKHNLPKDYDLILVDGPKGSEPRVGFLKNLSLFRTDVPIVIDDTNRPTERLMAQKVCTLIGHRLENFERFSVVLPKQKQG